MKTNLYNYIKKSRFSPIASLLYQFILKIVVILGLWRYPSKRDPEQWFSNDFQNMILYRMYHSYKLAKPIKKPEKGSKLEEYFAEKRRQINQRLLPKGFQGKTGVTISAVGDLINNKSLENSMDTFYSKIAELIFNVDISIANLESTLTNSKVENTGLQVNANLEQFNILKGYKDKHYTIFCTANNHILDRGIEGFETTHDRLEAEGFFYVGTNRSPEDQKKGLIITSNGIKFGFVAATYSVNKNPFPNGKDYLVNLIPFHRCQEKVDVSLLEEQISYCLNKNCDFIIVSLHWGIEYEFFPWKNQVNIAHHLIEYGADAIISHHTHNVQPYEIYQTRRDPYRKAPIFYGLGNLSSMVSNPKPYFSLSLIANFDVVKGFVNGVPKTLVAHVNGTPVLQMEYICKKIKYIQIEKLSDLIKSTHSKKRNEYINKAVRCADLVLGKSWRN
jgi:poly-gamma-glutamate synthesis protein (capsule biosynthesis protein)